MKNANDKTVAIVLPLSYDNNFNESENNSPRRLEYYLDNYHRYINVPHGLHFSYKDYKMLSILQAILAAIKHLTDCCSKKQ
jgi:hypothetical protein